MDNYNREMDKRRKIDGQDPSTVRKYQTKDEENDDDFLRLSLSSFSHVAAEPYRPSPPVHNHHPPPPPPPPPLQITDSSPSLLNNQPVVSQAEPSESTGAPRRRQRSQRNPSRTNEKKSAAIPPPFPWATDRRATVHRLTYLLSKQISTIKGEVQCKRCERQYTMEFDSEQKFREIASFIAENKGKMAHRAPEIWKSPILPRCRFCEQDNSVKPVISDKKRKINWLFLLLGQMLGCCTLEQLKYFCKHTKNHRTGAKDRVLYLTYMGLCKQLVPDGLFDID